VTKTRIPFIGRIPVLGALFTMTNVIEEQKSLFLFVTFEIVQ
jgi:pilus assembly protein CpaC